MGTIFNRDDKDDKEASLHFRPGFMKEKKGDEEVDPDNEFRVNTRKSENDDNVLNLDDMLDDAEDQATQQDGGEITI